MIYLISDTHFNHTNIIKYCDRPFINVVEMNQTLVNNWNNTVKDNDIVLFLGDFAFKEVATWKEQLKGNITFIRGNHDDKDKFPIHSLVFKYKGKEYFCTHKPENYDKNYPINFVGHVHQKWKTKVMPDGTLLVNMSVDVWDFKPVSIKDILESIFQSI